MENFEITVSSVFLELKFLLSSSSGEDKHVSLEEQGLQLAYGFSEYVRGLPIEGAALAEINFWGPLPKPEGSPIRTIA
jgi:hypothetical protein